MTGPLVYSMAVACWLSLDRRHRILKAVEDLCEDLSVPSGLRQEKYYGSIRHIKQLGSDEGVPLGHGFHGHWPGSKHFRLWQPGFAMFFYLLEKTLATLSKASFFLQPPFWQKVGQNGSGENVSSVQILICMTKNWSTEKQRYEQNTLMMEIHLP